MESKRKKITFLLFFFTVLHAFNLKTGDIILRKEANVLSDLFAQIDYCGYSHSGIVIFMHKKPYVCDIEYNNGQNLEIIPFKKFLQNASAYVILRPKFKFSKRKLKQTVLLLKKQNIKFDLNFSLNNKNYYCTELIDSIYYKTVKKHIYAYLYKFHNKKIITVKSLLKSPVLKKIYTKKVF